MKSLVLGGVVALLAAAPALAGPAGTGLTLTEEVARRNAAKQQLLVVQPDRDCARQAAKTIQARDGVAWAKARSGGVLVAFHSSELAADQADEVRAVAETCRTA